MPYSTRTDRLCPFPIPVDSYCGDCPRRGHKRQCPGDGPQDARVVLIGESPGFVEDRTGVAWSGPGGDELNRYLREGGYERREVYITNVVKCYDPHAANRPVSTSLAWSCAVKHLRREIHGIRPERIVLMGRAALALIPKLAKLGVDLVHGRTFNASVLGHKALVTVTLNPGAGLRSTTRIREIHEDFTRPWAVEAWPVDPFEGEYDYLDLRDYAPERVESYTGRDAMGVDTETLDLWRPGRPIRPWGLTFALSDATGYLIRADDSQGLAWFADFAKRFPGRIYLHNEPYDAPILQSLGVTIPREKLIDTQRRAYIHGELGHNQSLKVLSYRRLGITMTEYLDVVGPHYDAELRLYLERAAEFGTFPPPQGREWPVQRRITAMLNNDAVLVGDATIREKYNNWPREFRQVITDTVGPAPELNLDLVPADKAKGYACLDAIATRRLGIWQERSRNIPDVQIDPTHTYKT